MSLFYLASCGLFWKEVATAEEVLQEIEKEDPRFIPEAEKMGLELLKGGF